MGELSELKPERFGCLVRLIGRRLSYKLNDARQMRQNGIPVQAAKEHSVHLSTDARLLRSHLEAKPANYRRIFSLHKQWFTAENHKQFICTTRGHTVQGFSPFLTRL